MNRFELMQLMDGIRAQLAAEATVFNTMLIDTQSTMDARNAQEGKMKDLEARMDSVKAQITALDEQAKARLKKTDMGTGEDTKINAVASLVRSTMRNKPVPAEALTALGGFRNSDTPMVDNDTTGGTKLLPTTLATEILTEPFVKNPLRDIASVTSETNLEIPKVDFTIADDTFITDGATAKELVAKGDSVVFGRFKTKIFCDISETTLLGTNTNLAATVENGLRSGLAAKEKNLLFDASATTYKHMSLYAKDAQDDYVITAIEGATMYDAIIAALGDLEDDYSENACVVMRRADYLAMVKELSNGSATLFGASPESVLGVKVVFCDKATIPVVGDFRKLHINYDPQALYEKDKNIKTGLESFVLTTWYDIQIKLFSAFRLAIVVPPVG